MGMTPPVFSDGPAWHPATQIATVTKSVSKASSCMPVHFPNLRSIFRYMTEHMKVDKKHCQAKCQRGQSYTEAETEQYSA